jgi:hypothetical protein
MVSDLVDLYKWGGAWMQVFYLSSVTSFLTTQGYQNQLEVCSNYIDLPHLSTENSNVTIKVLDE